MGLFFLYLSVDDAAKIHERIGSTFDKFADSGALAVLEGYPSYTWQVTIGPLIACAALVVTGILWRRLDSPASKAQLAVAMGCLAAAVLLDVAEGIEGTHQWVVRHTWLRPFSAGHYLRVLEEFMEMLGLTLLLCLFLDAFLRSLDRVGFVSR